MTWTNINKPSASSYTDLAKPTISNGSSSTSFRHGRAIGLLIPLTISLPGITTTTPATYTNISKPSSQSWTNITKPT